MTNTSTNSMNSTNLRLAIIIGSIRPSRFGPVPARWMADQAEAYEGVDVDLIDLAELDLPESLAGSDDVAALGKRLDAADAFVVVTPEYNHSFPASLKTAIDYFGTEWYAKPVGFVSYGGMAGGLRAVEQLRQIFAELHAVTVRNVISFHNFPAIFDDDGNPHDASTEPAAKAMLDQLAWWGHALRDARAKRPYTS